MPHAKQQIRSAVVTLLTGLATTGASVFSTRIYNHDTIPSLNVIAGDESTDPVNQDGTQMRTLVLIVEARAMKQTGVDDQADTIQSEVETALHADYTLGGVCVHCELRAVTDERDDEGAKPSIMRSMDFEVRYVIDPSAPNTLIN